MVEENKLAKDSIIVSQLSKNFHNKEWRGMLLERLVKLSNFGKVAFLDVVTHLVCELQTVRSNLLNKVVCRLVDDEETIVYRYVMLLSFMKQVQVLRMLVTSDMEDKGVTITVDNACIEARKDNLYTRNCVTYYEKDGYCYEISEGENLCLLFIEAIEGRNIDELIEHPDSHKYKIRKRKIG